MKTAGIICEYNPLSKGHIYMINKVKEELGPINLVCIMSGNFVQRGKPAVMSKWQRAKDALENGVDLVVQMPVCASLSSAPYFAKSGVEIAKGLNLDYLVFGSTSGDLEALKLKAEAGIDSIEDGNDILGVEYIRCCGTDLIPYTIKMREDLGHASDNRKDREAELMDRAFPLIRTKVVSENCVTLSEYAEVKEGLENRIKNALSKAENIEDFILAIKSKRYTYTRICRILMQILLNIKSSTPETIYAHVLGFNKNGREIIRHSNIKLYSNISPQDTESNHDLDLDVKADDIYSILLNHNIYENSDYVCKPIVFDI